MLWKPWPFTSMITELHGEFQLANELSFPEGKQTKPQRLDYFASCLRAAPVCCKAPLVNGGCAGRSDHLRGSSQQIMRPCLSDITQSGSWVCPKICDWCLFKSKKWGGSGWEVFIVKISTQQSWRLLRKWLSDGQTLQFACFPESV